jgi:hypothetical protein
LNLTGKMVNESIATQNESVTEEAKMHRLPPLGLNQDLRNSTTRLSIDVQENQLDKNIRAR